MGGRLGVDYKGLANGDSGDINTHVVEYVLGMLCGFEIKL